MFISRVIVRRPRVVCTSNRIMWKCYRRVTDSTMFMVSNALPALALTVVDWCKLSSSSHCEKSKVCRMSPRAGSGSHGWQYSGSLRSLSPTTLYEVCMIY